MRAGLIVALLTMTVLAPEPGGAARPIEPLVVGWEAVFTLSWESVERRGRTVVQGVVTNTSPYTIDELQLLLDGLDGDGRTVAQQVAWSPGTLPAFSQVTFEIAVRQPTPAYRVRVLVFGRLEAPSRGN